MSKITVELSFEDDIWEKAKALCAIKGTDLAGALHEITQLLRSLDKHGYKEPQSEEVTDVIEHIRERVANILYDSCISLEELFP